METGSLPVIEEFVSKPKTLIRQKSSSGVRDRYKSSLPVQAALVAAQPQTAQQPTRSRPPKSGNPRERVGLDEKPRQFQNLADNFLQKYEKKKRPLTGMPSEVEQTKLRQIDDDMR